MFSNGRIFGSLQASTFVKLHGNGMVKHKLNLELFSDEQLVE